MFNTFRCNKNKMKLCVQQSQLPSSFKHTSPFLISFFQVFKPKAINSYRSPPPFLNISFFTLDSEICSSLM